MKIKKESEQRTEKVALKLGHLAACVYPKLRVVNLPIKCFLQVGDNKLTGANICLRAGCAGTGQWIITSA